jgi:hypothetical protein
MTGTMPVELALFPFLQSIDLSWNLFTGSLPSEYGTMKHLLNFEMHYNLLTGSIPNSWWDFLNLQRVNWAANFLTGTLPTSIAEMRDIKGLFLYDNMMGGTLPTEIGGLDLMSKFLSGKFGLEASSFLYLGSLVLVSSRLSQAMVAFRGICLRVLSLRRSAALRRPKSSGCTIWTLTELSPVRLETCAK